MNDRIAQRVVRTVASTTDSDALELPPLYDVIDPEALESLVTRMAQGEVVFAYAGHEVTVESDGAVSLDDPRAGHVPG